MVFLRFLVCVCCVMSVGLSAHATEESGRVARQNDIEHFMDSFIEEAVDALFQKDRQTRFEKFKTIAQRYFDMPAISNFLLGGMPRAREEKVIDVLENYIVTLYLSKFDSYGRALKKTDFVRQRVFELFPGNSKSPWNVKMNLNIVDKGKKQSIGMDWRVFTTKKGFKILDVYVEGISLSHTKKEEFDTVKRSKGFDGLIQNLKQRVYKA